MPKKTTTETVILAQVQGILNNAHGYARETDNQPIRDAVGGLLRVQSRTPAQYAEAIKLIESMVVAAQGYINAVDAETEAYRTANDLDAEDDIDTGETRPRTGNMFVNAATEARACLLAASTIEAATFPEPPKG